MSQAPELREVERRTARLINYEDGLWDLVLGLVMLALAAYQITRAWLGPFGNIALFLGVILLLVVAQFVLRRQVSTPRLGYVKVKRSPALKPMLAVTTALVVLTLALVVWTALDPGWLSAPSLGAGPARIGQYWMEILTLLVMVGLFSGMAYYFGVARLYAYGWLLGGANLVSVLVYRGVPQGFNWPMGAASAAILLTGLVLLIRFTRAHPVQRLEA